MPKINQFPGTTTLATTDVMVTETSTGTNTRKIAYSDFKTQIQNESKSVFALKGEVASDAQVADAVGDWLDAHVTPTGSTVAIDDTLLIQGAAADAKATGEMIIINGTSTNGTRVNITTTNTDVELAEMSDVNDLKNATTNIGSRVLDNETDISGIKNTLNYSKNVTPGYVLRASGTGNGSSWEAVGTPTDEQVQTVVDDWMDEHSGQYVIPDNNLTYKKLVIGTLGFVTPEMYGAKGDGATNDAEAIQNAIDNANGRTVYFPKGITYAISCEHAIKIPSYTKIILDGTIKATAANRTGFELFDFGVSNTPGYTGIHDVVICGTGVYDANGQNLSDAFMTPFRVHHCSNIIISGITIKNVSKYHAIEIGGSQNVLIDSVKFLGVYENNVGAGTLESVQIEKITESGTGGALPYDGTMCRNITIQNCYFGESPEGGKMYEAVGSHEQVSDADSTMNSMHDGIIVEGCVIENTSWKPGKTSAPLYDPSTAAIGFTYNVKNAIIRDNILLDVGVGSGIVFYQYCDSISIDRNTMKNVYGSGIVAYSNCSNFSIMDNKIDSYGGYCAEKQSNNMSIGIYVGATCHNDLKVKNNYIKTTTSYATLPIHLPGVAFNDFGKNNFQGNFLDVLSVLPAAQRDTFQNNYRRYNRDNTKILYENSSGIYTGSIATDIDLRLFTLIEITFLIGTVAYDSVIFTSDQILANNYPAIRCFNLPNNGTTAQGSFYEMNLTTKNDFMGFDIGNNIRFDVGNGVAYVHKYTDSTTTDFLRIIKIRGHYGQNMIV